MAQSLKLVLDKIDDGKVYLGIRGSDMNGRYLELSPKDFVSLLRVLNKYDPSGSFAFETTDAVIKAYGKFLR